LRWEIDLFGRLRRGNESRAQLLATETPARGVMNSLVASVATTWFELRELDEEVQIITDTVKPGGIAALVRSLSHSGVASGTEEQQALRATGNDSCGAARRAAPRAGREHAAFSDW
jgi:multidrug efflux system outer membrane protein